MRPLLAESRHLSGKLEVRQRMLSFDPMQAFAGICMPYACALPQMLGSVARQLVGQLYLILWSRCIGGATKKFNCG